MKRVESDQRTMSILAYFSRAGGLPDPNGPLSKNIPSPSIAAANKALLKSGMKASSTSNDLTPGEGAVEDRDDTTSKKRGTYNKVTPEMKAKIAKEAIAIGNSAAARKNSKKLGMNLNESSVRSWVATYKKELSRKRKSGEELDVDILPLKKRGRPLLLGELLDSQVKAYIRCVRESGGVITSSIVVAAGEAIVKKHNPKLFFDHGGHLTLTKSWAKSLLHRMQFVQRKSCSTKKTMIQNFDEVRCQFLQDVKAIVAMEDIPDSLIFNWDHTGIQIVPCSSWTYEKKGAKKVEVTGLDEKRQITAVVCGSLS